MSLTTSIIVFSAKAKLMQKILDYTRSGYDRFTSGTVEVERLERFVRKMVLNYHVGLDKHQRAHRKRLGLGNAVLMLYQTPGTDSILWWLLLSPGDHPATVAEKLQSTENITVFGFCLTRETRRNKERPVATWGMNSETYQVWRNAVIEVVRSKSAYRMASTLSELYALPGFSGIRRRIGQLAVLYRAEVKRHGLTGVAPPTPERLGYVRRLKSTGLSVRQVVKPSKGK